MSERGSYRATYSVMIDSREFRALSSDARLVLHTLKNSRINNMAGIFVFGRGEQITISEQAGISSFRVNKTIDILSEGHWIYYCFKSDILWVRNQLKFDPWVNLNNENHKIAVGKVIAGLPKSNLIVKFCKYYDLECPFEIPQEGIGDTIRDTSAIPSAITDPDPDPDPDPEKESISSGKPDPVPFLEIIEDLNKRTGKHFQIGDGNKRLIKALWNQGYRFKDFERVHTVKCLKWKGDPKMIDYLRPKTLYRASNFEGYLNEGITHGENGKELSWADRENLKAKTAAQK